MKKIKNNNILFILHHYVSRLSKKESIRKMPVLGCHLQVKINPSTFENCPSGRDMFKRAIVWRRKQGGTFNVTVNYFPFSCKVECDKAVKWSTTQLQFLPFPLSWYQTRSLKGPNRFQEHFFLWENHLTLAQKKQHNNLK